MYTYGPDTQERCDKGDGGPEDGTEMTNKDGPCERQQPGKQEIRRGGNTITRENKVVQGRAKMNVMVFGKSQDGGCVLGLHTPGPALSVMLKHVRSSKSILSFQ